MRVAPSASRWLVVSARVRLVAMAIVGVAVGAAVGVLGEGRYAPLCGWDAAALTFVVWIGTGPLRMGSAETSGHATRENPGRAVSDAILVAASIASLAAVGVVVAAANSASGARQNLLAGLAVVSVVLSWFAVHLLFMLRYAEIYYTGPDGGINFHESGLPPRYLDFAYLAFTIGMTFQVSDTDLTRPQMRSTALRHALISYLFGAVILASVINLVAGLGGAHH
jgi:uncharacterized membrane protein